MTKGTKIGIIIAVIVVVGVGGYFLYKKLNNDISDGVDENDTSTDEQEPQGTPASTPNVSDSSLEPTPFKNQGQGDYFRLWVNRWYPTDAKKLDLSKTGAIDNSFIRKAWMKYGVLYKQQVKNWNKIEKPMPQSFIDKFLKKDSYNFQIDEIGNQYLVPKISEGSVKFHPNSAVYAPYLFATWTDGGKKARIFADYRGDGRKEKNITADNFFELAKKIKAEVKKSNFSSFNDDNYGL
jgi:hypothetical protein